MSAAALPSCSCVTGNVQPGKLLGCSSQATLQRFNRQRQQNAPRGPPHPRTAFQLNEASASTVHGCGDKRPRRRTGSCTPCHAQACRQQCTAAATKGCTAQALQRSAGGSLPAHPAALSAEACTCPSYWASAEQHGGKKAHRVVVQARRIPHVPQDLRLGAGCAPHAHLVHLAVVALAPAAGDERAHAAHCC